MIGLQPFRKAQKHFRICSPKAGNRTSLVTNDPANGLAGEKSSAARRSRSVSATAGAPSLNVENAPPYLVSEIMKAYDADGLTVTGKGQTIAILVDTAPAESDLQLFWSRNSSSATLNQIEMINLKGSPLPTQEGEETLDVEWASGITPGAKIRIYATGTLEFVDLDLALDRIFDDLATQPGMRQLSISLGLGETFMGGPQGEIATQHQKFLRLSAAGINVFVSSRDAGSNPDGTGHSSTGPLQAEYESTDSCVVAIGGTSLTLAADGQVAKETAWTGSGGGKSIFFDQPPWRTGRGVMAGNARLVPDVSLVADPNTGAFLVLHNQVTQIGGTSWSAPVWAGFCALINEARSTAGKPPPPFLNPLIYPLMGSACFRDIQAGRNGEFSAGPGYDMVTGIGVPNVKELIRALTEQAAA